MKSEKNKIERVQVSIRIRPFNEDEKIKDSSTPIENIDLKSNTLQSKITIKNIIYSQKRPRKKNLHFRQNLLNAIKPGRHFSKLLQTRRRLSSKGLQRHHFRLRPNRHRKNLHNGRRLRERRL